MDFACVEGVFENVADGVWIPGFAFGRVNVVLLQVFDELGGAASGEVEVFDVDEVMADGGDLFGNGFAIVGFCEGATIAKWDLNRQAVDEDAVAHAGAVFATHAGDLGFGANG